LVSLQIQGNGGIGGQRDGGVWPDPGGRRSDLDAGMRIPAVGEEQWRRQRHVDGLAGPVDGLAGLSVGYLIIFVFLFD
jgi:hypothetical protein